VSVAALIEYDPLRDVRGSSARASREVAAWLDALEHADKAPRTIYQYGLTALDLLEHYPGVEFAEFTDAHILKVLRRYPRRGRPTREAHLAKLFKWGKLTRRIPENPFDYIERSRMVRAKVPDVFTEAEETILSDLASPDGDLLTLMFQTGLRKEECCLLQRRHINLKHAELAVMKAKGDKSRVVPLTPKALAAVDRLDVLERLEADDFLWYSKPGGSQDYRMHVRALASTSFARWWSRCIEASGVDHRKPHMTRHTRATRMRRMGYDLDEIQLWLGHESIETTRNLYVHTDIYDVARRMRELEAAV
jgi:integrase/recombinase XerD